MVGTKVAAEQLEAVQCCLPVDGLLRLVLSCNVIVSFTRNPQEVASELQDPSDLKAEETTL